MSAHGEYVLIGGQPYLYEVKAPFERSGRSIRGAIEYDRDGDLLRCHECGNWATDIGRHSISRHGLSGPEYRQRHGLNKQTPLTNFRIRDARKKAAVGIVGRGAQLAQARRVAALRGSLKRNGITRRSVERRNKNGSCPIQILSALRVIASRETLNAAAIRRAGLSVASVYKALNVSDVKSLSALISLPRKTSVFAELLRDFYVRFGLPRADDFGRWLPARAAFEREFGSLGEAYAKAGLGIAAGEVSHA